MAGVILIVGILAVGKESRFFTRKVEYWTAFPNVSGLAEGSPVQLVGVRVGTVSRVEFSPDLGDRQIRVVLQVNRAHSDRIREGTVALIKSLSYVSQERYIELTPGDPDRPVLPPGSRIEPGISGFAELTEMGRGIADDVKDITDQLRELLIALNSGGGILPEMIRNPDFGRDSLQGIQETVSSLQRISGRIERGEGLAGQLVMNKEYAARQMASLESSLDRLRALLEKIESGQGAAGEILAEGGKGEQLLDNLLSASADLKETLARIQEGNGLAGRLVRDDAAAKSILSSLEKTAAHLESITGLGFEMFWLDAYWTGPSGFPNSMGNYGFPLERVEPRDRFPHGLKAIGDAVEKARQKFLMWFEYERICPGTLMATEHPDWVVLPPGGGWGMYNLEVPEARWYMREYLAQWMRAYGISCLRVDNAVFFEGLWAQLDNRFVLVALLVSYLSESLRTARYRLQEETERAQQFVALTDQVVRSVRAGILAADLEGKVLHVNPAGARILMIADAAAVVGKPLEEVMPLVVHSWPHLRTRARTELLGRLEDDLGDSGVRLGLSVGPLEDARSNLIGFIVNFQDLTELEVETERRRMRDRMAAVGEMAARMAHEIKNPLASISGSAQVLSSLGGLDTTGHRLLNILVDESRRLSTILDEFLDYSRPQQATHKPCNIAAMLRDCMDLLRRSAEITDRHELQVEAPDEIIVHGEEHLLRQLFWNLSRNAIQAMPDGGRLTVSAERRKSSAILVWSDTGVGMSDDVRQRAFEPFMTTNPHGTGLGLAVVYTAVEDHGGSIDIDSAPGRGTTITVALPLLPEVE